MLHDSPPLTRLELDDCDYAQPLEQVPIKGYRLLP